MECETQTTSLDHESQEVPIEESFEMITIESESSPETQVCLQFFFSL